MSPSTVFIHPLRAENDIVIDLSFSVRWGSHGCDDIKDVTLIAAVMRFGEEVEFGIRSREQLEELCWNDWLPGSEELGRLYDRAVEQERELMEGV